MNTKENQVSLLELFYIFFKIGAFTFGSGYAMIPMIEREIIDKKHWFEKEDFLNQFVLAQSSPGPFSLNTAVFVGHKMRGVLGSLVSVLGIVLPSFMIILLIAVYFQDFRDNHIVESAFKGIRPAVISLIAVPFVRHFLNLSNWLKPIALIACFLLWLSGISPIYLLMLGAIIGILLSFYTKSK